MTALPGAILVMACAPGQGACVPGLEPLLGTVGCAALQRELIRHVVGWAARTGRRTWVAIDPPHAEAEVSVLLPASVGRFPQLGNDVGERLEDAVNRVAAMHAGPITVLWPDVPGLGPRDIDALELALRGSWETCAIGTQDGGFAALSLSRPLPRAFAIPPAAWDGPHVLELMLDLLRRRDVAVAVLGHVRSLATPDDARRLLADPGCPRAIRHVLAMAAQHAA